MKKITAIIMILVMVFALCGCEQLAKLRGIELPELPNNSTVEPTATIAPNEPSAPVAVEPAEKNPTRVIVKISKTEREHFDPAEGNTPILNFAFESPFVDIKGRDEAANTINEFTAMLDETYCTGNDYGYGADFGENLLLEMATDNFTYAYETGSDLYLEFSSNRTVKVERADEQVLTLQYTTYTFTGAVHGNYGNRAFVFDTEDGSLVTLDRLTNNLDEFSAAVLEKMKDIAASDPELEFIDNRDETLQGLIREGSWYLDGNGLVIFANPYEIASYGQGIVSFKIPYSELAGLIDDMWIPAPADEEGELSVILQSEFQDGSMEVIDRIVTDDIGEELCLVASGTVYDVRVSEVGYADYNGEFYETEHLWNCSRLDNCAVQIKTMIPDGMPKLMISYTSADGSRINQLISQSGFDGNIILTDDSIVAVG